MEGLFYKSQYTDPYINLAAEEYLLHVCMREGNPILYLWQNADTVVIGRNQNAYTECNVRYAMDQGIRIARRMTGGGAVYHDLGNLNYSIILPKEMYDVDRSTQMILDALNRLDLHAVKNGRNDICIGGKKVSGNAYYTNAKVGLHHGTLLYHVDTARMEQVLQVSSHKLSKKGILSVRARVNDLITDHPLLRLTEIKTELKKAFQIGYHLDQLEERDIDPECLTGYLDKYRSDEWNLQRICEYAMTSEAHSTWGDMRISVQCEGGILHAVEISTDALETDLIEDIKTALNAAINRGTISNADEEEGCGESNVRKMFGCEDSDDRKVIDTIEKVFVIFAEKYPDNRDIIMTVRDHLSGLINEEYKTISIKMI